MEKRTKIAIGVSFALITAASIGVYLYLKNKKTEEVGDSKKEGLPPSGTSTEAEKPKKENAAKQPVNDKKPSQAKPVEAVIPYGRKLYSTGDSVNIRLEPSTKGKVMARVNKNEEIGLNAGEAQNGYIGIIHKLSKGEIWWVAKQYVKA